MKKVNIGLIALLLIVGVFIVYNKLYYPQSPINNLSVKEILHKFDDSSEDVVMLSNEDNRTWYITRSNKEGIVGADEKIKKMISLKGWSFKHKDGSGLIFEKDGESLIITTEMWTSKYVLVKVPENY